MALYESQFYQLKQSEREHLQSMLTAAGNSNYDELKMLLEKGRHLVNERNQVGQTVLHEACCQDNADILKLVVSHGGDPDLDFNTHPSYWKRIPTPMEYACGRGHLAIVKYLVEEIGIDINFYDDNHQGALADASKGGHIEVFCYLLSRYPDIKKWANGSKYGGSIWEFLIEQDDFLLKLLKSKDFNSLPENIQSRFLNTEDALGTKLILSVANLSSFGKNFEVLSLLCNRQDVIVKPRDLWKEEWNILHVLSKTKSKNLQKFLTSSAYLKLKEDEKEELLNGYDAKLGLTPLHIAIQYENVDIISLLCKQPLIRISTGTKVDGRRSRFRPIIMAANHEKSFNALVEIRPDAIFSSDEEGNNCLHIAALMGNINILRRHEKFLDKIIMSDPPSSDLKSEWKCRGNVSKPRPRKHNEQKRPMLKSRNKRGKSIVTMVAIGQGKIEDRVEIIDLLRSKYTHLYEDAQLYPDEAGYWPIWYAAYNGHYELVETFLTDPTVLANLNKGPSSALWAACASGSSFIVELLLEKGANVDLFTADRMKALSTAVVKCRADIVKLFIKYVGQQKVLFECFRFGQIACIKQIFQESEVIDVLRKNPVGFKEEVLLGEPKETIPFLQKLQESITKEHRDDRVEKLKELCAFATLKHIIQTLEEKSKNVYLREKSLIRLEIPLFNEDINIRWDTNLLMDHKPQPEGTGGMKHSLPIGSFFLLPWLLGDFCLNNINECDRDTHCADGLYCECQIVTLREQNLQGIECSCGRENKCQPIQSLLEFTCILEDKLRAELPILAPRFVLMGSVREGTRIGVANEIDVGVDFVRLRKCFTVRDNAMNVHYIREADTPEDVKTFIADSFLTDRGCFDYVKFLSFLLRKLVRIIEAMKEEDRIPQNLTVLSNKDFDSTNCNFCTDGSDTEPPIHCKLHPTAVTFTKLGPCLVVKWKETFMSIDLVPVFHINNSQEVPLHALVNETLFSEKPRKWLSYFKSIQTRDRVLGEMFTTMKTSEHGLLIAIKLIDWDSFIIRPGQELDMTKLFGKTKEVYCWIKYIKDVLGLPIKSFFVKKLLVSPQFRNLPYTEQHIKNALFEVMNHSEIRSVCEKYIDYDLWEGHGENRKSSNLGLPLTEFGYRSFLARQETDSE